jgi:hypothetical protein
MEETEITRREGRRENGPHAISGQKNDVFRYANFFNITLTLLTKIK